MKTTTPARWAATLACAALLSACGGSDESTTTLRADPLPTKALQLQWTGVAGADAYRLLEDPDGLDGPAPAAQIAITDGAARRHVHPVYLPDSLNARYVLEACLGGVCRAVAHTTVTGDLAPAVGRVQGTAGAFLGYAVKLSADGNTLAIGSMANDDAAGNPDAAQASGAVQVFVREATTQWRQQARLKTSNAEELDFFGQSLALSADGNTLVVGAPGDDSAASAATPTPDNSLNDSGAVHVYRRSGDAWALQAYLKAPAALPAEAFGNAVALSGDGQTLLASAPGFNGDRGAVHVFRPIAGTWQHDATLLATDSDPYDGFGLTLAISHDGQRVAVGAGQEDGEGQGVSPAERGNGANESGAVYVFDRASGAWSVPVYLKASNAQARDGFGTGLALSADGQLLAVGAPFEGTDTQGVRHAANHGSGAVYLYRAGATSGQWTHEKFLKAGRAGRTHALGFCVALSGDGTQLVATAPGQDSPLVGLGGDEAVQGDRAHGAAYMWRASGTAWQRGPLIKPPTVQPDAGFGLTCALSPGGRTLAIGAMEASSVEFDPESGSSDFAGAVLLY